MLTMTLKRNQSRTASLKEWWHAKNGLYSAFTGDKVTNRDVVLTHNILVAALVLIATVETSFLLAIVALAWMGTAVWHLKKGGDR